MKAHLSTNYVNNRGVKIAGLIVLAFALDVAAAIGLTYVAGFGAVHRALERFSPIWLVPIVGGLFLSFVGYYFAYRESFSADKGPGLPPREMRAVVVAGFGGFFAHGGVAMDQYALQGAGADRREATVRAGVLGGLEHGALGIIGTIAGLAALLAARPRPPLDFQYPWAVIPIPGMLLAFWLAERYRGRFRERKGTKRKLGVFLDSIHVIRHMFRYPREHVTGPAGMTVFWLAELGAAWCALEAFGFDMNGASFALGFLTGAVFTRRTGPLTGAGILMLCLPVTIWYSGAPFGPAIAGIFVVRFLSLWLPLPFSLAALPTLRRIGVERRPGAEGSATDTEGEPAIEQERRAS